MLAVKDTKRKVFPDVDTWYCLGCEQRHGHDLVLRWSVAYAYIFVDLEWVEMSLVCSGCGLSRILNDVESERYEPYRNRAVGLYARYGSVVVAVIMLLVAVAVVAVVLLKKHGLI